MKLQMLVHPQTNLANVAYAMRSQGGLACILNCGHEYRDHADQNCQNDKHFDERYG